MVVYVCTFGDSVFKVEFGWKGSNNKYITSVETTQKLEVMYAKRADIKRTLHIVLKQALFYGAIEDERN